MANQGPHTVVRASLNPEAGQGLFAARDFEKGDWIADLTGDILPIDQIPDASLPYAISWRKGYALDPLSTQFGSVGHLANSPYHDPLGRRANAKFAIDRVNGSVNVRATRHINTGEEILINYGAARTRRL